MSDKSDTKKLCAMLDERGIEYCVDENGVGWHSAYHPNDFAYDAAWYVDTTAKPHTIGALSETTIYGLTPEQAIAATVGMRMVRKLEAENEKLRELVKRISRIVEPDLLALVSDGIDLEVDV